MKNPKGAVSGRMPLLLAAASIAVAALAWGCSGTAQQATARQEQVLSGFQLSTCKSLNPGLYQCPGSDKPVCDPDYTPATNPVNCVHVDRNGKIIVQTAVGP